MQERGGMHKMSGAFGILVTLAAIGLGAGTPAAPLVQAARAGNRQAVRDLLKKPVDINAAAGFQNGTPRRLFELPTQVGAPAQLSSVSSPDGQRFVFAVAMPRRAAEPSRDR